MPSGLPPPPPGVTFIDEPPVPAAGGRGLPPPPPGVTFADGGAEMRIAPSSIWNRGTEAVAQSVYHHLKPYVGEDWANGVADVVSKVGPHSGLDVLLQGLGFAFPALRAASPLFETSAPFVSRGIEALTAPGLAGTALRAGTSAAAGAGVAAAGGQSPKSGAELGALTSAIGDVPEAAERWATNVEPEQQAIHDAAQQAEVAQRGFSEAATGKGQAALESLAAAQQARLRELAPAAQVEATTAITGRTPTTSARAQVAPMQRDIEAGIVGPGIQDLAERSGGRGAYFDIKDRIGGAYSAGYQNLLGQYSDHRIGIGPIRDVLDKWESQLAPVNAELPGPTVELLKQAQTISPRSFLDTAGAAMRGKLPQLGTDVTESTIGKVLELKRAALKFASHTSDDRSAAIAEDIADAAQRSLEGIGGLPPDAQAKLRALNAKWGFYKKAFPLEERRAVAKAQNAVDAMGAIAQNPEAIKFLAVNAKPAELKSLQDGLGNWLQQNPEALKATSAADAEVKADAFGTLFPKSPLSNPKAIQYAGLTMDNIEQTPAAQRALGQALQEEQDRFRAEGAKAVRDIGVREARKLGPVGQAVIKRIQAAKTPEDAAAIATEYFTGLTPENFVQQIGRAQGTWGPSVAKTIGKPLGENQSRYTYWVQRLAENPASAKFLIGYGGLSWLMWGRPGFMGAIGAASIPFLIKHAFTSRFVQGLADPVVAREFMSAATSASRGLMRPLARSLLRGTTVSLADSFGKPDFTPDDGDTKPHSEGLIQSRAEALAPTSSATKRAVQVTKALSRGRVPNVHRDLNSGRLTSAEVGALLKDASSRDLASVVHGFSISELLDDLEQAAPAERQILLPMVRQRLIAELPREKNRTLQANLSARFKRLQAMSAQPTA
jgi:hypothetical protein